MESLKVFISQPMRGKTREQIEEERTQLVKLVEDQFGKEREIEILDTIFPDFENLKVKNQAVHCLGWAIQKLASADIFCCLPDEDIVNNPGCQIEKQVAKSYKIRTLILER